MMGRAERRRTQKLEQKAKTATYNLTKKQLNIAVREQVGKELERIKQEATDDAVNTAMVLLLTLPLEVLIVCLAGVIALKAISASTTYMDDSFRWGGRDGY